MRKGTSACIFLCLKILEAQLLGCRGSLEIFKQFFFFFQKGLHIPKGWVSVWLRGKRQTPYVDHTVFHDVAASPSVSFSLPPPPPPARGPQCPPASTPRCSCCPLCLGVLLSLLGPCLTPSTVPGTWQPLHQCVCLMPCRNNRPLFYLPRWGAHISNVAGRWSCRNLGVSHLHQLHTHALRARPGSFSFWCPHCRAHSKCSKGACGVNGSALSEPLRNHRTRMLTSESPPHPLLQPRAHPGTSDESGSKSWLQNVKRTWDTPSVSVSTRGNEGKNRTYSLGEWMKAIRQFVVWQRSNQ